MQTTLKVILSCLGIAVSNTVFAQQQTIAGGGGNATGAGGSVSFTVGQAFYSSINTPSNGSVAEGVQVPVATVVLPIKLLSFTGGCYNEHVKLSWATAYELNNKFFNVERSADGIHWSTIGKVNSVETPGATNNYIFDDADKNTDNSYYRLQQVDISGVGTYSNTIFIKGCSDKNIAITIFPNPATNAISISTAAYDGLDYELRDVNNRIVQKGSLNASLTHLTLTGLPAATYFIMIRKDNKDISTFKFSKQ